jgi:hypothetical protein
MLGLTFYWESLALTDIDYTVFVHLLSADDTIVAQMDRPLTAGVYPTSLWSPGEIIPDSLTMSIPATVPPGAYTIVVGLYNLVTGQRLSIAGTTDNSLKLPDIDLSN